jgi:hypothetical protein
MNDDGGGIILWELQCHFNIMLLAAFKNCLLGCDDMYFDEYLLTVERNFPPSFLE